MRTLSHPICSALAVLSLVGGASLSAGAVPARAVPAPSCAAPVVLLDGRAGGKAPVRAFSVAFSPDGRLVACGTNDGTVRLVDSSTRRSVRTLAVGATVEGLAFSPDARALAGASDNHVALWDLSTGKPRWRCTGGSGDLGKLLLGTSVAFTPDGRTLVVSAGDDVTPGANAGAVALFDAHTGRLRKVLVAGGEPVNAVAVSPDGKRVAGVTGAFESEHPEVYVWDRVTGEAAWVSRADAGPLFAVAFSPDGKMLATGGRAGDASAVCLWDAASGALIRTLPHGDTALTVAFSPDGRTIVTGGLGGTLKLWDPATGRERGSLAGAKSPLGVFSIAFAPDGRHFAAASDEGTVRLWTIE